MSLAGAKNLTPAEGCPANSRRDTGEHRLNIYVIFTSVRSTLVSLKAAGQLAHSLDARIMLVVPQVVPWPLPLERGPVSIEFNENRFRVMAGESQVETSVHMYLCRDKFQTLSSVLPPGSIVVLGGPRRLGWPTTDQALARNLRRAGFEVIFKETEGG